MLMIICPLNNNKLILERFNKYKYILFDNICLLKKIKDKELEIILDCNYLNNDGTVEEYNFQLDEILISKNVKFIFAINPNEKISEICDFYNIPLIKLSCLIT